MTDKMTELVRRADVQDEIDRWLDSVGTIMTGKGLSSYGELIGCLEDAPAADVTPVRHGRWISWEEAGNPVPSPDRHECSVCHDAAQVLVNGLELLSDYCPNCGAKMDGGNDAPTVGGRLIDADTLLQQLEEDRPYNWGDSEAEMQAVRDWEYFCDMVEALIKQ